MAGTLARYDLSSVDVLLIEPQLNARRLLRSALSSLGLDRVVETDDPRGEKALATGQPDVLLVDGGETNTAGFDLIRSIRHSTALANPFTVTVMTTWTPTETVFRRAANAGADDLIAKPFASQQVHQRVTRLVEAKRRFRVTGRYIGPDRGQPALPGRPEAKVFDVPNTLQDKALGTYDPARNQADIGRARRLIDGERVNQDAFEVALLLELAVAVNGGRAPIVDFETLLQVPPVLADLLMRLGGLRSADEARTLGQAMLDHFDRLRGRDFRVVQDLPELKSIATRLHGLCNPDFAPEELTAHVRAAADRVRKTAAKR